MTPRRSLAAALLVCWLSALGGGTPVVACNTWEHRWMILSQGLSHTPAECLGQMWKVWYSQTYGKDPPRLEIYPGASPSLPLLPPPAGVEGESTVPPGPQGENRILVYAPEFEEQSTWKLDEALLPELVLRWDHTVRAIIRWTEIDPSGQVVDIGETPLLYGWNQTLGLGGYAVPILQFQRITSSQRSTDLFQLLETMLPRSPDAATATPFPPGETVRQGPP